jgi:hypothetical protein
VDIFFERLFLQIFIVGLIAGVNAVVYLIRARSYYVKPQGLGSARSGLARLLPSNYAIQGAARVRVAFFSLLLCAFAWIPAGVIHLTRYGSLW